ncbi:5'-nucleotidase, lipoprotein e(P4) family [Saccharopolyspora griseoalba]|uniref:5'-nucleotidase, lipoprotein e(P4) family n=1 Tax=Saccharopolyspora griseoalba TaxID=1431848 RepID=A0ABW2LJ00_9PSEU
MPATGKVIAGLASIGLLVTGLAASTGNAPAAADESAGQTTTANAAGNRTEDCPIKEYSMGLRYQQSPTVDAMQRQAWLLAQDRLSAKAGPPQQNAKKAVVVDLDETVLDNTALLARDLQACHDYTSWDTWKHWEREGDPALIPGAAEFFDYADERGFAIYYISDRYEENKKHTIDTLTRLGLPQVSEDNVLLHSDQTPGKDERRAVVSETHEITLLVGDSLHDFRDAFGESKSSDAELLADNIEHIGRDWIVLPNSSYGDWDEGDLEAWDAPLRTEN